MALPRQVEKQLKEVEALEKSLKEPVVPEAGAPAPEPAPTPEPPIAEATPPATPAVPVEPPKTDPVVDWEHKYRSLQGKYNAEVPQLMAQVREMQMQLADLSKKPAATTVAPTPKTDLVTAKDIETYGEDLIDLTRRVARETASEYQGRLDKLEQENTELRKQLSSTGAQIGELTFEQRLHRAIPDFQQVNADPKWFAWLDQIEPLLGVPRRAIAMQAMERGDEQTVARFVSAFKQTQAPVAAVTDQRQAELSRQVQPNRTPTADRTVAPTAKTYTEAQAVETFNRVRVLNSQGKFAEAAKLEAEISAAYMEGRVRG